jgi:DNA-binding beta-propeller fold protein YncE
MMLIATVACSQKKGKDSDSELFLEGKKLVEVTNKKLDEASGLAASSSNPGLLWTHNDSGNRAEIFLVDDKLDIRLTCTLANIINRDWEDISVGPGPEAGKNYIYVADIGDNMAIFPYKIIYRFEEPKFTEGTTQVSITNFDRIVFQLDVKKDTESLLIDPKTKNLYVVSKREKPVYVYELKYPYSTTDTLTAQKIGSIPFGQIVAGDFSADGNEVLMKNYNNVLYWRLDNENLASALKRNPAIVTYEAEPQGEAVTFARDGSGFYTISERVKGERSFLWFYPRKK